MPTPKKGRAIKSLARSLDEATIVLLSDYRGLTVAEMGRLRRQLRESSSKLEVAKNTLVKRAATQIGFDDSIDSLLVGPTALVMSFNEDIASSARAVRDYARTSRVFKIKGGFLGRRVIGEDDINRVADLPSREVLLGQVVGGIQAPVTGLVTVLSGTLRGLVNVLDARKNQLSEQQGG